MLGNTAYALLNKTIRGIESGVKSHEVRGLTLYLTFNDGSTAEIEFEQPKDGKDGLNGKDGADGKDGKDGPDGKSAYQVAVDEGFVGTEEEWLESLQGKDGVVVTCKFPAWEVSNKDGNTVYIATGEGYLFIQNEKKSVWEIEHNFGNQYPSVVCVDDNDDQIQGKIHFRDENVTIVTFTEPVKGKAFVR